MSKEAAIKVENLSKLYRIGEVGTGSLAHDVNRWWHRVRGKEDPYSQVGQVNDRTKKAESDWVWALKDINFEVKQGEVLGIIGRNGAGKSTLLKILSRITAPTYGEVKIKGRIASLLEVGTGFHPDLTGRENVFLNGAILGMTNAEIRCKFDAIVSFAGIESYVDTPVKRYSSGMYVRLAFAVAAHLESEILVIDEVLAVGDVEFQQKCIGKMHDLAQGEGRTVLFVSHNMTAVQRLCSQAVLIHHGQNAIVGRVEECVNKYFSLANTERTASTSADLSIIQQQVSDGFRFISISLGDSTLDSSKIPQSQENFVATIEFQITRPQRNLMVGFSINTKDNTPLFATHNNDFGSTWNLELGHYKAIMHFSPNYLRPGTYSLSLGATSSDVLVGLVQEALTIEVQDISSNKKMVIGNRLGSLFIPMQWELPIRVR